MKKKNQFKAWIIFGIYFVATCALLLLGYSVREPNIAQQEFPFSITYSYQGKTETVSKIYVVEYVRSATYIGDDSLNWFGYIKDHDRLQTDYFALIEEENQTFSVNLNMVSGYLMGDPTYAGSAPQPTAVYNSFDGTNSIEVTDPAELETLGFSMISWEYPEPIANSFTFGGISLSSEATIYAAAIAVVALLASMVLIKKDKSLPRCKLNTVSIILNFLVALVAFPFILIVSVLSEIVADASALQQLLYLAPALTALGVAASVTLRRMGRSVGSLLVQFIGPAVFALPLLLEII